LIERTQGRIGTSEYVKVAGDGILYGAGDWVFAPALYGTSEWRRAEYEGYLASRAVPVGPLSDMQRMAPSFIERLADEITATDCEVVGLSTTFKQNVAALALARALKRRRPEVIVVMGGANCDGPQGAALHRNFPFVDFVVRGEGEQAFPDLLDAIAEERTFDSVDGLCWRDGGRPIVNRDRTDLYPIEDVPSPNFDAYFEALPRSVCGKFVSPKLPLESSRGCWWGEKHHCTFCGLNGMTMKFRSKSPQKFWSELSSAIGRYKTLDLTLADNIIDMEYFHSILPWLSASGWDLSVAYEVKSNLTRENIDALHGAGINHIQPGIENLSTHVLKLMDKGIGGCQNVFTLRECAEVGVAVNWNYLYGFPGETETDYRNIIDQMPALVHLKHPTSVSLIALERFSPNFDRPSLGFSVRRPASFYQFIYELPESELSDLVYLFDTVNAGISGKDIEKELAAAVSTWRECHQRSRLSYRDDGETLWINDTRANRPPADYVLRDPREVAMYRRLRRPQRVSSLASQLRGAGAIIAESEVGALVTRWRRTGLVFEDDAQFVALAHHANPQVVRERATGAPEFC
jgi:ribosomal peptide maturation radical SAM protein 1